MSGVYWGALMNAPNPGQAFAESFGAGMQQAQEQRRLQAEKQEQLSREQQEEWKKYAGNLAAWADTPEKWDEAVNYLAQSGYPAASQLKGKFSQGLRAHFMAQAGIAPPQAPAPTALQKDYEYLKGVDPKLAEQFLRNRAEGPPMIASNGDGTFTIIPRGMVGGQGAAPPPPPPGFVLDSDGGQTGSAPSGEFPDPLAPL